MSGFLSDEEFSAARRGRERYGGEKDSVSVYEAAAIRLLLLTGCRKNEIVKLKWKDVDIDAGEIRLVGRKDWGTACAAVSGSGRGSVGATTQSVRRPWVILGARSGRHLGDLQPAWERVRERAGLEDVRIHDFAPQSFASRALALGESLPMIGKLLGHTQVQTTARYAHLQRDSIKASASRIAGSIGDDLRNRGAVAHPGLTQARQSSSAFSGRQPWSRRVLQPRRAKPQFTTCRSTYKAIAGCEDRGTAARESPRGVRPAPPTPTNSRPGSGTVVD